MKSVPNPSLRGMTTDLLKNLDAQERLRAGSVRSVKSNQVRFQSDSNKRLKSDTESQHRLAVLYHAQKKFEQAERLYQECLTQYSLKYGLQDPRVGQCLNNVGRLYFEEGWYAEAEPLLERSLQIVRNHYGPENAKVSRRLTNLGDVCFATDRSDEGLEYYRQAAKIELKELGASATSTLRTMRAYVAKLRKMDRIAEAEALEKTFHRKRETIRRSGSTRRSTAASSAEKRTVPSERRHHAERRKRATRRGKDVD